MKKKMLMVVFLIILVFSGVLFFGKTNQTTKSQSNEKVQVSKVQKDNLKETEKSADKGKKMVKKETKRTTENSVEATPEPNRSAPVPSQNPSSGVASDQSAPAAPASPATEANTQQTNSNDDSKVLVPLPTASIGVWGVKDDSAGIDYTITILSDGTITKVNNNDALDYIPKSVTTQIDKVYDRGNGNYQITFTDSSIPFILGIGGLGGANIQYAYGMRIDNNTLKPIIWQTGLNRDFDYNSPLFAQPLTRQ